MSKPVFQDVFSWHGRRNRKSYALVSLLFLLALLPVQIYLSLLELAPTSADSAGSTILFIQLIVSILIFFAQLTTASQRCRDIGKSGWMSLLLLIPLVNIIFFIFLLFAKGADGQNDFGPDPLDPSSGMKSNVLAQSANFKYDVPISASYSIKQPASRREMEASALPKYGPHELNAIKEKYSRAYLVIEYDQEASKALTQIERLPKKYLDEFLQSLENNPRQNSRSLADEISRRHLREMRPYDDEEANDALNAAREISEGAATEFMDVYKLLQGKVSPCEILKKIEAKFGPTTRRKDEQSWQRHDEQRRREAQRRLERGQSVDERLR